ncbi:hypothetical protein LZ30DRAFT_421828 [Colletotrichum cereale]|nr:hypothetical protein LZ30DRAFT_421828 [Colletotrichum cereale]
MRADGIFLPRTAHRQLASSPQRNEPAQSHAHQELSMQQEDLKSNDSGRGQLMHTSASSHLLNITQLARLDQHVPT